MDAEGLALQIRFGGEVDVSDGAAGRTARRAPLVLMAVRDLRRDWRRWSAVERLCAIAFCALWGAGAMTAALADAHWLPPATITRLRARPAPPMLQVAAATVRAAPACCDDRYAGACPSLAGRPEVAILVESLTSENIGFKSEGRVS